MKNLTDNGKKIKNYFAKSVLKRSVSDNEFDELLKLSISSLYQIALDKVSITEKDCIKVPVIIIGPPNFRKFSGLDFDIKKGKDDYLRFIPVGVTIYNFAEHSLLAYQCDFDPTTENPLNENTFEYFYNDIVSFETVSESSSHTDYDWKDKILKNVPILKSFIDTGNIVQGDIAQKFILTTAGGSKVSVTLAENLLKEATQGGEFHLSIANKSINVVRRIIRDKKSYTFNNSLKIL